MNEFDYSILRNTEFKSPSITVCYQRLKIQNRTYVF